jgi:lysozyme
LYNQDITIALNDARSLHFDFDDLPDVARIVIASLSFQLGLPRYQKFKLHHAAIEAKDWREAAAQLRDSSLYRQTTNRTERHAKRLESIDG